ncbi:MAG: DNA polymerase [Candidatus Nanopelagicales bacterium]
MAEMPSLKINVLDSPDKVAPFWEWLTSHHDYIAADTETTGLNVYAPDFKVRLFQFGDTTSGWGIPFQGWRELVRASLAWLADRRVKTIWHNLSYDLRALESEGIKLDLSVQEDTYVWESLCGFAHDSRQLKVSANRKFGSWAQFGQKLLKTAMANAGWDWASVPIDFGPYAAYGVVDPIITAMDYETLAADRPKFQWHHSLEIAVIGLTSQMARNGLAVDTEYCLDQVGALEVREQTINDSLRGYGIESAGQNVVVAKVLEEAGVLPEIVKLTATGQIQVDKEFLATIDHPVARQVLASRSLLKTKNYLLAMLRSAGGVIGPHELIHPEIRSIEARTGRMSIADPALQQLPSPNPKDPDTMIVRRAIVPRSPDEVLVGADFGQIELRMFASLTQDQALLDVLNMTDEAKKAGDSNADFFVNLGRDLYHDPHFVKSDVRRSYLKSTMYATIYSAGEEKIAETAKVPQAEIHAVLVELQKRYPSFRTLGAELIAASAGGIWSVHTPTGRRFAVSQQSERRKLLNYLVQGHSAEILKMALMNVAEAGYERNLLLPVHDEIIMSVPKADAARATADLVEAMNAVVDPAVYGVAVQASASDPAMNWAAMSH